VNVKNYALNFTIFKVILEGMLYTYDDIIKKKLVSVIFIIF